MKKIGISLIVVMIVYSIAICYYFFHQSPNSVPAALRGSASDPAVFMTPEQMDHIHKLSTIRYLAFFLSTPMEWVILLLILASGVSAWFRDKAEALAKPSILQVAIFLLLFQLTLQVIQFPLDYYLFELNHRFGLSEQPLGSWIMDRGKSFGINFIVSIPLYWLLYRVMRKSPRRWWLWGWGLSVPITLFFTFIQPVVLEPVFNDFKPLQDQQLKHDILRLAKQADIPTEQVYEVDKSRQTNELNAYVSGIGPTTRIVLWDTTLQKLSKDEILFIMAHEMGHYVRRHVLWGTLFGIAESFVGFWLVYRLFGGLIRRFGKGLHVRGKPDIAGLPALVLLASVLGFAASPIDNTVSRLEEHSADQYAIELRKDPDAGVRAFQRLAADSLADVNPPWLAQMFLGSHPTLAQRIDYIRNYR